MDQRQDIVVKEGSDPPCLAGERLFKESGHIERLHSVPFVLQSKQPFAYFQLLLSTLCCSGGSYHPLQTYIFFTPHSLCDKPLPSPLSLGVPLPSSLYIPLPSPTPSLLHHTPVYLKHKKFKFQVGVTVREFQLEGWLRRNDVMMRKCLPFQV